jgi:chemotaxis response regulator CheB
VVARDFGAAPAGRSYTGRASFRLGRGRRAVASLSEVAGTRLAKLAGTMTLTRDITVIGASAGGITALRTILGQLPADYPAAVFAVLHLAPESPPVLHDILARSSTR